MGGVPQVFIVYVPWIEYPTKKFKDRVFINLWFFSLLHKFHKYKCIFLLGTTKYKKSVFLNLPMNCLDPVWSFPPLHKFHKYKCLFLVSTKKYKDSVFHNLPMKCLAKVAKAKQKVIKVKERRWPP